MGAVRLVGDQANAIEGRGRLHPLRPVRGGAKRPLMQ
jgi:hypothetical protein